MEAAGGISNYDGLGFGGWEEGWLQVDKMEIKLKVHRKSDDSGGGEGDVH